MSSNATACNARRLSNEGELIWSVNQALSHYGEGKSANVLRITEAFPGKVDPTAHLKGVLGSHERVTVEDTAQGFELGRGSMYKVGQGARCDFTVLTVAFAQEDG